MMQSIMQLNQKRKLHLRLGLINQLISQNAIIQLALQNQKLKQKLQKFNLQSSSNKKPINKIISSSINFQVSQTKQKINRMNKMNIGQMGLMIHQLFQSIQMINHHQQQKILIKNLERYSFKLLK
ncbi:unnamed protein product [Paramecium pentaurelia]|uniref:Uncharacterized protein n=1 Tax=Paramecium pentaurelia TaxID=43138 RepID=A0A8S1YGG7_9CILI|nr:unnamed protein product [Paramecium pentaurelia]